MNLFHRLMIVVLLFITFFSLYMSRRTIPYKGRGYCSIQKPYRKPTVHKQFISNDECAYLRECAEPLFKESKLVSGHMKNVRKSETAWLSKKDPVVAQVISRVCALCDVPFSHAEKMQVVKYGVGDYYHEHFDASCDDREECVEFEKNGGQRVVTMILYLNDDFEGGHTVFPKLRQDVAPVKNNGLLFYSLEEGGAKQCHPLSLHAGKPVKKGTKYIANVWLRERPYATEQ